MPLRRCLVSESLWVFGRRARALPWARLEAMLPLAHSKRAFPRAHHARLAWVVHGGDMSDA